MPKHILVGDQFSAFAKLGRGLTPSDVRHGDMPMDGCVEIGLGLDRQELSTLLSERVNALKNMDVTGLDDVASLEITHKRHLSNVLITVPRKLASRQYTAQLVLGGQMDRLLDHVSGYHVSGMILVEAGRQVAIATGELEYELGRQNTTQAFIWTSADIRFERFLFPVATDIQVTIQESSESSEKQRICTALVSFHQAGKRVSAMELGYEIRAKAWLAEIEEHSARRVLSVVCDSTEQLEAHVS